MKQSPHAPVYPDAKNRNEFERGLRFQDYVIESLAKELGLVIQIFSSQRYQFNNGESVQGWEIKLDSLCTKTRRLSIEVAEKSHKGMPTWTPSGIFRKDNTLFYVQGNRDCFWLFFKKHLQWLYERERPTVSEKHGTIRTFYLPISRADKVGLRVERENTDG